MRLRSCIASLFLLSCAFGVNAERVKAELSDKIRAMRSGESVRVIVRCTDPIDVRQFTERDRKLRRQQLTTALKNRANGCERILRASLRNGVAQPTILWTINAVAATVPVSLVDRLAELPGVESVTLDAEVIKPAGAGGSSAPSEWNIQAVRAPELWALGYEGSGVVIAAMDTGVDPFHPDIGPKWRGGTNSWFDPNGQHATPHDADGHGTSAMGLMVGGEAGGSAIGVAPGAQWVAVKIFNDSGLSLLSRIHEGFQWLLDPDDNPLTDDAPDIVNNSWYLQGTVNACSTEFASDIAALKAAGIAVVFAGGNAGPNANTSVSPPNDPLSVAVGAVDVSLTVADFSSRGASACDGGIYPGIVAPGTALRTADLTFGGVFPNSYRTVTGTSFAAPHLAAGMALLKGAMEAQGVPVTVSLLETAVAQTAADLGPLGPDNNYGVGLLDLMDAYDWLLANAGTPQPGQLQLSAAAYNVAENVGSVTITVTRVGGTAGDVGIAYATANGSATAGQDYVATSGTLTFLAGQASKTFVITILDDTTFEADENLSVNLSAPTGGATLGNPSSALLTILNNDPQPQPGQLRFSAATYSVVENGAVATITVTRTGGSSGSVSVNYATANGSATAGADYAASAGTLSFAPGVVSRSFDVAIVDDASYEGNETVNLVLSSPTGGATLATPSAAVLTIVENDPQNTNNPPVAVNDAFNPNAANTAYSVAARGVLINDTDADPGQTATLTAQLVSVNENLKNFVLNSNGSFSFGPMDKVGTFPFTYRAFDGTNVSNLATVSVKREIRVTKAEFTNDATKRWNVAGKSSENGAIVSIYLGPTTGGTLLGTATVSAGAWSFTQSASPNPGTRGAVISVDILSTTGGAVTGVPINCKKC